MDLSDSMFLFEIIVEELNSFIDCNEFYIRSQFADVFTLNLKDPNDLNVFFPKQRRKKKSNRKSKVRDTKSHLARTPLEPKLQSGQSVLLASTVESLILNMKKYPIELTLWSRDKSECRLGSTQIPWSLSFVDYLNKLHKKPEPAPVAVAGTYNIFHEYTSKRMAVIKLNIKLSYFKDKITSQFRAISEDNPYTFMYSGFNSTPSTVLSTVKEKTTDWTQDPGIIKTIYRGRKGKKPIHNKSNKSNKDDKTIKDIMPVKETPKVKSQPVKMKSINRTPYVKSQTDIECNKQIAVVKSKSCSSISRDQYNILNYIFGDTQRPFGNQVYCVGYFTVENDPNAPQEKSSEKSLKGRYQFKLCSSECPSKKDTGSCSESVCSLDLPEEAANLISITKCKQVDCNYKVHRESPEPVDDRILLDLSSIKKDCCDVTENVEEVVGGMTAKMKIGQDPCYCECECRFGFMKKTTYCRICGGYEVSGEDMPQKPGPDAPFPCPIYHKLDKAHAPGVESKKSSKTRSAIDKSGESEKDKKGKKKKKDDRFKFNYGYTAPQIGHSRCAFPCTGTMGAVPKNMGWLWTADNIPGMKFRPMWKPGATNKHVVRLLKMAKNPGEVISKKRKKESSKRPLKRPLLIVHKKEGEYTVTMETCKTYTKPRTINQYPYEDKPLLTYTIGRTEEENKERQRKKERARRRLEREQREFIQSAFRDMCQEICLKTYQQALGILPDTESPDCPCYPAHPGPDETDLDHSCSCSEDKDMSSSDTDNDEWIVEFTPPNATFDPTYKTKKVIPADNSSQYTYLDYRVKLLDQYGNPVPRFFKGPDGKQQCSDLGGFWSPDHKWLEINIDGYIAPDDRWAPNTFIGPNGDQVDTETGKFQCNGKWLVVGIDGYIDPQGRWKSYPRPRADTRKRQKATMKKASDKKGEKVLYKPASEATWSCFGEASPTELSKMGIVGHGQDKKLLFAKLKDMLAHGEDVRLPQPSTVPRRPPSKKGRGKAAVSPNAYNSRTYFEEKVKCRHPVPSEKGVIATDARGHKTYFRLKEHKNRRPKERMANLTHRGISLSSFHVPCFHSFISTEVLKKQQFERIRALYGQSENRKSAYTQV